MRPPPCPDTARIETKTSPLAVTSLVLGILSLCCFGIFTGLPAVICGHKGLSNIKKSQGRQKGEGLAVSGLVTGYVGSFITSIAVLGVLAGLMLPALNQARTRAQAVQSMANLRGIGNAIALYSDSGANPLPKNFQELIDADLMVEEMLQSYRFNDPEIDYIYLVPIFGYSEDAPLVIEKAGARDGERFFLSGDMNFVGDMDDMRSMYGEEKTRKYLNP